MSSRRRGPRRVTVVAVSVALALGLVGASIDAVGADAAPRPDAGMTGFAVTIDPGQNATTWNRTGGNQVVIQARWDQLQPRARGPLNPGAVDRLQRQINQAATTSGVIFEVAIQYPPASVKAKVPAYVNQAGTRWSGGDGADVRDWVFSNTGRKIVADFINKVMGALDLSRVWAVRTGGGWYDELHYPPSWGGGSAISYWAYGAAPQTGADIATNEVPTPLPGYRYGTGTARDDARWASWYTGALVQFERWLVTTQRRAGWTGPLFMMHPGYGMRDSWKPTEARWRRELAEGNDWRAQLDAYTRDVHPWSTWLDAPEPYGSSSEDSEAPWRKLYSLAAARGVSSLMWGENTAGADNRATSRVFGANGPIALGYSGVSWVGLAQLTDGSAAKLTQLENRMTRQKRAWSRR